jgi:hypothetical protein
MNNKIFVYKINNEIKTAVIASSSELAKNAIKQKYPNMSSLFYGELDDIIQVNGVADLDGAVREVTSTDVVL